MKKLLFLTAILSATAIFSNVSAQITPPGAGDKDLRDTDVKRRSNELERIDRDARKENSKKKDKDKSAMVGNTTNAPEDTLAAKYADIKTDYEQIQISQDSVIKTYQGTGKVDYTQLGKFSSEINKSAVRLKSNLFPVVETPDAEKIENKDAKSTEKTTDETTKKSKSVREIIVDLDNTIGSFATSPMFQNLRVVDPKVSEKTKADLEKIIELSAMLDAESQKIATNEK